MYALKGLYLVTVPCEYPINDTFNDIIDIN